MSGGGPDLGEHFPPLKPLINVHVERKIDGECEGTRYRNLTFFKNGFSKFFQKLSTTIKRKHTSQ
jgi:hypothetical protein